MDILSMHNPKYRVLSIEGSKPVIQKYFPWFKWVTFTSWYTVKGLTFNSEYAADDYIFRHLS